MLKNEDLLAATVSFADPVVTGEPVGSTFLLKQPNSKSFLTLCWNTRFYLSAQMPFPNVKVQ